MESRLAALNELIQFCGKEVLDELDDVDADGYLISMISKLMDDKLTAMRLRGKGNWWACSPGDLIEGAVGKLNLASENPTPNHDDLLDAINYLSMALIRSKMRQYEDMLDKFFS